MPQLPKTLIKIILTPEMFKLLVSGTFVELQDGDKTLVISLDEDPYYIKVSKLLNAAEDFKGCNRFDARKPPR